MGNDYVQDYSRQERLIRSQLSDYRIEGREEGREEGRAEGLAEGYASGLNDGKVEIAKKMIKANKSFSEIEIFTDLSLEELTKLKEENE